HGIAGTQLRTAVGEHQPAHIVYDFRVVRQFLLDGHAAPDLIKGRHVHGLDEHLVLDAAEKGGVSQVIGIQLGREYHHHFEQDLELEPVGRGQVVDAAVKRHNPAIQQLTRRHDLAAKVIDEEDAVVRLHLHGGREHAARLVIVQLEHAGNQLAAHHDEGPL